MLAYSIKNEGKDRVYFTMICSKTDFKNNSGCYRVNVQVHLSESAESSAELICHCICYFST